MTYDKYFKEELDNPATQYFILDTKGDGEYGDVDFVQYQWSRSKYNLVKEGDIFIYRRPSKASETGKFYFFGAAKIDTITGSDRVTAQLVKTYPFQEYIHQNDLDDFKWTWKERGQTWEHFFNQYGMNKINKFDFVKLMQFSEGSQKDNIYDPEEATIATQNIQKKDYSVDDKEGILKVRSNQQVFSNKVKTNYGNRCAVCSLSTKQFLVGSHIIPWSVGKETRLDPSNGICLCSFHDKAFDEGFITIDDKYIIKVTQRNMQDLVLLELLKTIDGNKLHLPKESPPDHQFLKYHRESIFDKF